MIKSPNLRELTILLLRVHGLSTVVFLCLLMRLLNRCVLWAQVSGSSRSNCTNSSWRTSMGFSTLGLCFGVTVLSGTALAMRVSLRTLQLEPPYFFMFIKSPMLPRTMLLDNWKFVLETAGECWSDSQFISDDLTPSDSVDFCCSLSKSDSDDRRRIFALDCVCFSLVIFSFSHRALFEDNVDLIANKPAFNGKSKAHSVVRSLRSIVSCWFPLMNLHITTSFPRAYYYRQISRYRIRLYGRLFEFAKAIDSAFSGGKVAFGIARSHYSWTFVHM